LSMKLIRERPSVEGTETRSRKCSPPLQRGKAKEEPQEYDLSVEGYQKDSGHLPTGRRNY